MSAGELTPARAVPSARDLAALAKPRITLMVVATGVLGALAAPARPPLARALCALVGTALLVAGANALNMWLERDTDARMPRTRDRPVAAGRISPGLALGLGLGATLASLVLLAAASFRVAWLGAVAWGAYVALYTPMKRWTRWSLPVGAIAGAMPPAMGWATASDAPLGALYLFLLLFTWQLPHFLAISLFRGAEYAGAGLAVGLPPWSARRARAGGELLAYAVGFVGVTLTAPLWGLGGPVSVGVAALSGGGLLALAERVARAPRPEPAARALFAYSMGHLAIVLGALGVGVS